MPVNWTAPFAPGVAGPGRRLRRAARVFLHDEGGRLLLFRFVVDGMAPFWCTPGGECEPDEDFTPAARRELIEETGIEADPGPELVQIIDDWLLFDKEPITADERFFRVATCAEAIDTGGHTELERAIMREHRWFTRAELATWPEQIFPLDIVGILAKLDQPG